MKAKELRDILAHVPDDAIICISDVTDKGIKTTSVDVIGNQVYLNTMQEFPDEWYDEDGVEINYNYKADEV